MRANAAEGPKASYGLKAGVELTTHSLAFDQEPGGNRRAFFLLCLRGGSLVVGDFHPGPVMVPGDLTGLGSFPREPNPNMMGYDTLASDLEGCTWPDRRI